MSTPTKNRSSSTKETAAASSRAADDPAAPRGLLSASAGLKLLVLVSGAVLMGLEIVGSRILAPYFGNSVFVWGSLISLFLIALSLGYYFGGRLADRHPSRALLSGLAVGVAAILFVVAGISRPVCTAILEGGFGEQSGPFLAGFILFLLPSVGMGMVSPLAIRLAASGVDSLGRTAGTLYALSTLGSIAGTMITTFVLIPWIGAGAILKGLAGALLAAGVASYPFRNAAAAAQGVAGALVAGSLLAWGVGDSQAALPPGSTVIEDLNTPYHHITVLEDTTTRTRQLKFDRFVESAIELDPPHRSMSGYTYYFHLALGARPQMDRALFIGAGGGVGPRAFLMHNPQMEIDVVDIDPLVLEVARRHFYMDDRQHIHDHAVDGRIFVRTAESQAYDAVILDAFTIGGRIPFHLATREFFELCRDRLRDGGVFLMNINSAERGPKSAIYRSMFKTVAAAFDGGAQSFVLLPPGVRPEDSTNIILLAINGAKPLTREEWLARLESFESDSYVDRTMIESMIDALAAPPVTADAPLFTDDYAPIETMSF
jgi:spermidine synthase